MTPLGLMERRSPRAALEHLPAAPSSVLIVGDAGGCAGELRAAGYRVTVCPVLDPPPPERPHAAAIVIDLEAIDRPLDVLGRLHGALEPGGKLIVAPGTERAGRRGARLVSMAQRCGFLADAVPERNGVAAVLTRDRAPSWQVGLAEAHDAPEIRALFEKVFGRPMSQALWDWKYAAGRGGAVLVRHDGRLVGHYGRLVRRLSFFGQPALGFQVGDVMVAPEARRGRRGPFALMTSTTIDLFLAWCGRYLLSFGFPGEPHMRLGELLGFYVHGDTLVGLRWPAGAPRRRPFTRLRPLDPGGREAPVADALWLRMQRDLDDSVVGVRDWAYLQHRYLRHPEKRYDVRLVSRRVTGSPVGIIVLADDGTGLELVDVIGPLRSLPLLVDQARRLAALAGREPLHGWITRRHAGLFLQAGAEETPLGDARIALRSEVPGVAERAQGRLWLTPGDTDCR